MIDQFKLVTDMTPGGDQPEAIEQLIRGFREGKRQQTLLGVTGSGKTFTMAHVIETLNRPTLVMSHNKTLAAQLYGEFKEFFPENAVGYFVSYYDYYQPEAYIPQRDIYIEKDASINEEIDRLRLQATAHLMTRRDVIIVASVSCIYGLGSPEDFKAMYLHLRRGQQIGRDEIIRRLVDIRYERKAAEFVRGQFRVRGDTIDVFPATSEAGYRVELFGSEIDRLSSIHPVSGEELAELDEVMIYPARHFVMPDTRIDAGVKRIADELEERIEELRLEGKLLEAQRLEGKLLEAQRLEARTRYDMELLIEFGYCPGIENYSRPLAGRAPGSRPFTLIDYYPADFLMIVDESHASIPQIRGMYHNDLTRKTTLIEHGFRLKSALDNRPMKFEEWEDSASQVLFVSATPGDYELERCEGEVVEQIIRPTGLIDPVIRVRPARNQVEELIEEIKKRVERKERCLVTTLTKRMAEDLSEFLRELDVKVTWLHSEIGTIERVEILNRLRAGDFDVLVGVNLLREGLDLPEVSFVAIMDADKEGFLRSATSLVQTIGRTARNVNAEVVLYGDSVTRSMQEAMDETARRREIQAAHNEEHGIKPATVRKAIRAGLETEIRRGEAARTMVSEDEEEYIAQEAINELEAEMHAAAEALDFERAAELRDRIDAIRQGQERRPDREGWRPRRARSAARGGRGGRRSWR